MLKAVEQRVTREHCRRSSGIGLESRELPRDLGVVEAVRIQPLAGFSVGVVVGVAGA